MERDKVIITTGKISFSDVGGTFNVWTSNIFMLAVAAFGLYYVNTKWNNDSEENNILFGNIALAALAVISLYSMLLAKRKLKVNFYPDKRSSEIKEQVILKQKKVNRWRLKRAEKNYYLFYENNLFLQSYYITIVYDEIGFYLNCFPVLGRVIDFGRSQRWCDELYDDISKS